MSIESMKTKRQLMPCGDRVLVKLKTVEEVSAGGVILAKKFVETQQFATQEAFIMALGHDAFKGLGSGLPWCKVGDRVRISKYSGDDLEDIEDGAVYRLIHDEDIFGVYEGEGLDD